MENLMSHSICLRNMQRQAKELTSDSLSLANICAQESSRLNREDEASRLKALYSSVKQQMDKVKRLESAARYGYSRVKLTASLVGLGMGIAIKMMSKDEQSSAFSNHLLRNLGGKERPFGTVVVCIGPKGLPDDVGVISISELARESNREESEVISELRECGHLLFSEEAFSRLIDRLIAEVQEERLLLPVPTEKLAKIQTSSWIKLKTGQTRRVLRLEPPHKPRPSP
jgi:hypothetical protein